MSYLVQITNYLGDNIYIATSLSLIIGGFLYSKYYRRQAILVFIATLSLPYSVILKLIFQHERPDNLLQKYTHFTEYYSFPSTHVVYYVAFWGFILYLCFKLGRLNKIIRIVAGALSSLFILLVGASRIIVGAHYPKDVFAGYLFGGIFLCFLIILEHGLDYPHILTREELLREDSGEEN